MAEWVIAGDDYDRTVNRCDADAPCAIESMEANVDKKYLNANDYERAIRMCERHPNCCREKAAS